MNTIEHVAIDNSIIEYTGTYKPNTVPSITQSDFDVINKVLELFNKGITLAIHTIKTCIVCTKKAITQDELIKIINNALLCGKVKIETVYGVKGYGE